MAIGRMISKKITYSEQVAALPIEGQLLFERMIIHADDVGLLPGSISVIKAMVIPLIDLPNEAIESLLNTMKKVGLIEEIEVEKTRFWWLKKFNEMQNLRRDRKPHTILPFRYGKTPNWIDLDALILSSVLANNGQLVKVGYRLQRMTAEVKGSEVKGSEEKKKRRRKKEEAARSKKLPTDFLSPPSPKPVAPATQPAIPTPTPTELPNNQTSKPEKQLPFLSLPEPVRQIIRSYAILSDNYKSIDWLEENSPILAPQAQELLDIFNSWQDVTNFVVNTGDKLLKSSGKIPTLLAIVSEAKMSKKEILK